MIRNIPIIETITAIIIVVEFEFDELFFELLFDETVVVDIEFEDVEVIIELKCVVDYCHLRLHR